MNKAALKKAGIPFIGHTELLAALLGEEDFVSQLQDATIANEHYESEQSIDDLPPLVPFAPESLSRACPIPREGAPPIGTALLLGARVPAYERAVEAFSALEGFELIFVDDGSTDSTPDLLVGLSAADPRVRYVRLSRNFGHQTALTAGIDFAVGDTITTMDGDLQNDPRDIGKLLEKIREGYDVVSGWRKKRKDITSPGFH